MTIFHKMDANRASLGVRFSCSLTLWLVVMVGCALPPSMGFHHMTHGWLGMRPLALRSTISYGTLGWSSGGRWQHRPQGSRAGKQTGGPGGLAVQMCGVIGILLADREANVAQELYDGLTLLQHRGQDAAGIATSDGVKIHLHKDRGLARDVFSVERMLELQGAYGVGHVRYPTSGRNSVEEAQPLSNNVPIGFCVAHNGHLTNKHLLKDQLATTRHFNTDSDTELLSELFSVELAARRPAINPWLSSEILFDTVEALMFRCRGGYAVTIAVNGLGVLAFRDPHGIRPLCMGNRRSSGPNAGKMDLAVASESAALTGLGFSLRRDVGPGEAVFLDQRTSAVTSRLCSRGRGVGYVG
ncbi:unnamed protein product, partial [Discosporangium mesarthrocarpum]